MYAQTKRQKQILETINHHIEIHGHRPTYQQIASHLGLRSKAGVAKHIAALEQQGLLIRQHENGSFALQINTEKALTDGLHQIEWLEDLPVKYRLCEEPLWVPRQVTAHYEAEKLRLFLISDDAMTGEQMSEGDVAILEKKPYARDGDVVVAWLPTEGRVAFRQFYRVAGKEELRAANNEYETEVLTRGSAEILGVCRGLIRPLR
jgi:repressor LexA